MSNRTKVLLVTLIGGILINLVAPSVYHMVYDEVTARQKKLARVEDDKKDLKIALSRATVRSARMKVWSGQSLPRHPQKAARVYQQWLTDLAEDVVGLDNVSINAGQHGTAKKNAYKSVKVVVNAEGKIVQVRDFLFYFYRANLLHRVVKLKLEKMESGSDPTLKLTMTAEGLSVPDAELGGPTLFARTRLSDITIDTDTSLTELTVESTDGFPEKTPFEIRVGYKYLTVTEASGNKWIVDKPLNPSRALSATVEFAPVDPLFSERQKSDFDTLVSLSLFEKPRVYNPLLQIIGKKDVQPGGALTLTAKLEDQDPEWEPDFSLVGKVPDGMKLEKNVITWNPPGDLEPAEYVVEVEAKTEGGVFSAKVTINLRPSNEAPTIGAVAKTEAVLGQEMTFTVTAEDTDGSQDDLLFSLADNSPAGTSIDPTSGKFVWTPPETVPLGDAAITINVSDRGEPPKTTSTVVTVTVKDDVARFTYLTAAIAVDQVWQAWLFDQMSNKSLVLRNGDQLRYGNVQGKVLEIGRNFVQFERETGKFQLDIGKNLREMVLLEAKKIEPKEATKGDTNIEKTSLESPNVIAPKTTQSPKSKEGEPTLLEAVDDAKSTQAKPDAIPAKPDKTAPTKLDDATPTTKPDDDKDKPKKEDAVESQETPAEDKTESDSDGGSKSSKPVVEKTEPDESSTKE